MHARRLLTVTSVLAALVGAAAIARPFLHKLSFLIRAAEMQGTLARDVVPPVEPAYLAENLRGDAPVQLLLSGLISHAAADQPMHANYVLQLAGFWADLLSR